MKKNNNAIKALAAKKAAAGDDAGKGFYKESAKFLLNSRSGIGRKEMKQIRNDVANRARLVAQMQKGAVKGGALPSPQRGGNSGFLGGGGFRKGGR